MKTALKIIFSALLISAAAAGVVLFFLKPQASVNTESLLETANNYCSVSNYSQAVIEYYKLLNIDPKNADAYIGMADAYIGINERGNALNILDKGYSETKDARIREKLELLSSSSADAVIVPPEPIVEEALPEDANDAVLTSVTGAKEETDAAAETVSSESEEAVTDVPSVEEEPTVEETTTVTEIVTEEASLPETSEAITQASVPEETSAVSETIPEAAEEPSEGMITIPDFTAMTIDEAIAFAEENELDLLQKEAVESDAPSGTITYQFIPVGFSVPPHTTVVVVVNMIENDAIGEE